MKHIYLLTIVLLFAFSGWSQIAPGSWDYHLNVSNTQKVVQAGQKIYFMSKGGIYYFNKKDNSIETLDKTDNLSGFDFTAIAYNETTKCLIISYSDATIDIVKEDGTIVPIFDIKRKAITGDKRIWNIHNYNEFCYLACSFGIVVVNLKKMEIKDSYIIGEGGNNENVFDVAVVDDYIFAATNEGIKHAPLNGVNLLDYSTWTLVENPFLPLQPYHNLEVAGNRLWAVHNSEVWHGDKTYSRHAADLWYPEIQDQFIIHDLKLTNGYIVYAAANSFLDGSGNVKYEHYVQLYDELRKSIIKIDKYSFSTDKVGIKPSSAIVDNDGTVWIADENYGAVRYENGIFTQLTPQGPFDNNVLSLSFSDGTLWAASGGRNTAWGNMFFDFNVNAYADGKWKWYNQSTGAVDPGFYDAIQVLPVPGDPNHFFVSTLGFGILEYENGTLKKIHNDQNSSLQNIFPGDNYVRIGGMAFDSKGNLWASNSEVARSLHKYSPDGKWQGFVLEEIMNSFDMGSLLVTQNDDIWMIIPRNKTRGIYVMSNDGTQTKHLDVSSLFIGRDNNGNEVTVPTSMNDVYSLVQDLDGEVWVGTSNGVTVYSQPENVFTEEKFYSTNPSVDLNDGIYHPLLENFTVTSIVVDGGNQKWCGTRGNGLFLISDNGEQELEHFTTENSPIISNNINSLAYDGATGMLYIGTDMGIVSYRTKSTTSNSKFGKIYAYPNPVRENYTGDIYITGLVYNTNVKITTTSGRLVYETTSEGGQAVWNGKDLAGNRVHTGVYLAFCSSPDGNQSAVTKILFIR